MTDTLTGDAELLPGSASTWRTTAPEPRIPEALHVDATLSPRVRLARWQARHALRRQRAQRVFADSGSPERGLPVAGARSAFGFVKELVSTRKAGVVAMIAFNVAAAIAALVVPRLLGNLVDDAAVGASLTQTDQVLLLGFDCSVADGTHWHGDHPATGNPDAARCRQWMRDFLKIAAEYPGRVINCSRKTALDCFPRSTIGELLEPRSDG